MKYGQTIAIGCFVVAGLLFAAAAAKAQAPTHVIVHVASVHTQSGYNNTNPGIGLRWADAQGAGPVAGVYYNSERSTSVYAGYAWNWHIAGPVSAQLAVGGVSGYRRASVVPMVMPSVSVALSPTTDIRLSAIPPIGRMAGVAHLSFDFKF